jgi:hypothetical protein
VNYKLQYESKFIANLSDTKSLRLCLKNTMDWRAHIDNPIPQISSAWYAIRTLKQIMPQGMLMIYYASFHSLMSHGIIFWGNSPYSILIFRLQEKKQQLLISGIGLHVEIYSKI